jgi:predicted cobalt transporter CbtA
MRSFGSLLLRGLLAGLFAGLLAGTFAYVMGEPHIDAAIAIEESHSTAHDHDSTAAHAEPEEEPLVSRDGQRAGLFLATGLYGVALGGILATGFALLRRRFRTTSDGVAALALAGAGFLGMVLVPFLKYPPNPPAVGNPDTITRRIVTYLMTIVIGLLAVWLGAWVARRVPAQPVWLRFAAGAGAFVATVVAAYLLLPSITEVPDDFPAVLLWRFRFASLGTQTVLWSLLGVGYAAALDLPFRKPAPLPAAAQA